MLFNYDVLGGYILANEVRTLDLRPRPIMPSDYQIKSSQNQFL